MNLSWYWWAFSPHVHIWILKAASLGFKNSSLIPASWHPRELRSLYRCIDFSSTLTLKEKRLSQAFRKCSWWLCLSRALRSIECRAKNRPSLNIYVPFRIPGREWWEEWRDCSCSDNTERARMGRPDNVKWGLINGWLILMPEGVLVWEHLIALRRPIHDINQKGIVGIGMIEDGFVSG